MELSINQKNELFTGIVLAQELKATLEQTRRFITVKVYFRRIYEFDKC